MSTSLLLVVGSAFWLPPSLCHFCASSRCDAVRRCLELQLSVVRPWPQSGAMAEYGEYELFLKQELEKLCPGHAIQVVALPKLS